MKESVIIPSMGESIQEVTIGTILRTSGSQVSQDDEILEIETDKVNQVLYAPSDGTLTLSVNEQDVVRVGDEIGYVESGEVAAENAPEVVVESVEEPVQEPVQEPVEELETESKPEPESKPESEKKSKRPETKKPLSSLRKKVAERLVASQKDTASLTTFNEVDMTKVIDVRNRYKEEFQEKYSVKLGFMSFFVKAAVNALSEYPIVNSYMTNEAIVERGYIDISIAISTERGLIVPVLRNADKMSFAEIEKKIIDFAERAKNGRLTVDELQGGSFTITNGGVFGSVLSTPILNPPQVAILGMHAIQKRAWVVDDEIVVRPIMNLALTYDHRVIDGKEAVGFLLAIKNNIEDPMRIGFEI